MNPQAEQAQAIDRDDRRFAATWLLAAAGIHLWVAAGRFGIHVQAAKGADLLLACASYATLAWIAGWSFCALLLRIEGSGRRTLMGIAAMMLWPLAAMALHPRDGVGLLALANGLAAFAMFGRCFPVSILDGLFSSSEVRARSAGGVGR